MMTAISLFVTNTRRLRYALTLSLLLIIGITFWELGINSLDLWLYNSIPLLFALSTLKLKMLFVQGFVLLGAFLLEEARYRRFFSTNNPRLQEQNNYQP
jgi:chromate transport protein ChrA